MKAKKIMNENPKRLYRRSDPASSRKAAEGICRSGKHLSNKLKVLAILERIKKGTSKQVGAAAAKFGFPEIDRYEAARRLPELVRLGFVNVIVYEDGRENVYEPARKNRCFFRRH